MAEQKTAIRDKIVQTKDLDDAALAAITQAIGEFQKQYASKREATARA